MKSLFKFFLFCLFFLSFSQIGFGQSDSITVSSKDKWIVIEEVKTDTSLKTVTQNVRTGETYTYFEVLPQFPGGIPNLLKFINANLRFPDVKMKKNSAQTVIVTFDILETGEVSNPRIKKGAHPLLNEEALRLINLLPRWRPAMQNGKPVKVEYNFPLRFNR